MVRDLAEAQVRFSEGRLVLTGPAGLKRACGASVPAIFGAGGVQVTAAFTLKTVSYLFMRGVLFRKVPFFPST